jgi:SAM-dependent methyltransferase
MKNGYALARCHHCGLIRTDLHQNYALFVDRYYREGYFTGDRTRIAYVDYEDDKPYIMANMRKFFSFILPYKKRGTLLDVGCALGFSTKLALQCGFDAYGIDPSDYAVARAMTLVGKSRVRKAKLSDMHNATKKYDVIAMFDVFEHLSDPRADLATVHSILKDDGIVILATGDTGSLLARVLGRRWTFINPPQHLYFYNRHNLTRLLGDCGFESVAWKRIGKWLSLRYVLHLARTGGESRVADYLYRLAVFFDIGKFPLFLPTFDNMVVIAKKQANA